MRAALLLSILCLGITPDEQLALKPGYLLEGHGKRVLSVAFSHDSKRLATGGEDGTARIWNVDSGEEEISINTHWAVTGLVFSKDDKILIDSSWGAQVWDIESGDQLRHLEGHTGFTTCIACTPDVKLLATGGLDGTVRLWDTKTWQETKCLIHGEQVSCIAISPDGNRLVSGGDTTFKVWELSGKEIRKTALPGSISTAYLSDSKRVALSCGEKGFCFFEPSGDSPPVKKELGGQVGHVAISSDGKMLAAVVNEKTIQLWNLDANRKLLESEPQKSNVNCVAFSPNGKLLACGFDDHTARLWSLITK